MFRLSVSQFCSYRWSLFQDIVRYSKCGITGIGLWRRKLEDFGHDEAIDLLDEMLSQLNGYQTTAAQLKTQIPNNLDASEIRR